MKKIIVFVLALIILISSVSCTGINTGINTGNNTEKAIEPTRLDIANMPFITEYTVGESNKLCLDGLAVLEYTSEMGPHDNVICWSDSDMKYDDSFCLIGDRSDIKIEHNVDFDKCGEYTVTVKHTRSDVSVDFFVYVVEDEATPVESEEDAVLLAKRYVYSKYSESYYQSYSLGPTKYEITASLEDGVWTVAWIPDFGMSEYMVFGGGGPQLDIDADTGEIISCGLQQ